MTEKKVARRRVLQGVGAATGGLAAAGLAMASPASADERNDLLGSYLVTRRDDPPLDPNEALFVISLAGGGVLISNDISPLGLVATGAWKRLRGSRFTSTFWGGFAEGPDGGPFVVRVRARGEVDDDKIRGTYRATVFDATGKTVLFQGTGSFRGTRIEA